MKAWLHILIGLNLIAGAAAAAEPDRPDRDRSRAVIDYPATFFDQYHPATALEMLHQLPGFNPDNGADKRGYGGAAGNILINDRRPSSKQDDPTDVLGRIPAARVQRIELIRGPVRDIELLGYTEVANVVLQSDAPAAVRWEAAVTKNPQLGRLPFKGSISLSDRWRGIDYNTGLDLERYVRLDRGSENFFDPGGVLSESRFERGEDRGVEGSANLNAAARAGATLVKLNSRLAFENGHEELTTRQVPRSSGAAPRTDVLGEDKRERKLEVGLDLERNLFSDLGGKLILLHSRDNETKTSSERRLDAADRRTRLRRKRTETRESESIVRLELDWTGRANHAVRFDAEGARNVLDNAETETEDTGGGPVVVSLPGANARVEELRGDFLLQDTWSLGDYEMEYGLGAETSRLSQSGDAGLVRNFFFLKPRMTLVYSPSRRLQTRLRIEREVAQLDFKDFVSATAFKDDERILGNPELRPETTWIAELSQEWRFGGMGVIKLTGFHHWIADAMDLLPLTPREEAAGNIGAARRWGLLLETTLPLQRLGLAGARLDLKARWQDSTVTDPVTGSSRVLSSLNDDYGIPFRNENEYALLLDYRQDFRAVRWAWGWDLALQARRPRYKADELEIRDEGVELNVFIESSRWLGVKIRLEGKNLLDYKQVRRRILYSGARALSSLERVRMRHRTDGREVVLYVSGTF